jgi:adenylate kinase family enzyme
MADTLVHDARMRRMLVVGWPGAGKSTFARRLGAKLGVPVIHLDFHYWRPGWQLPDLAEWREQVTTLVAQPAWVIDGNYANTFDIRMPRADSVVWLDYPRAVCMRRVLRRIIKSYGHTRPDLPPGCPEKFDLEFLRYVWDFPRTQRSRIPAGIDQFGGHLRVTRFGCDRDAENFLSALGAH